MKVEFDDDNLRRLYAEPGFRVSALGRDVTKQFRKKVAILVAAVDERDLRAMRSLHYEKLTGDRLGQRSIRLNKQWRLILRLDEDDDGQTVIVIEIVDYH